MTGYRKFVYVVQAQRRGASCGPWIISRERWQPHYLEKDEAVAAARRLRPDYCNVWVFRFEHFSLFGRAMSQRRAA